MTNLLSNLDEYKVRVHDALTLFLKKHSAKHFNELSQEMQHQFCRQQSELIINSLNITFNNRDLYPIVREPQWNVTSHWFGGITVTRTQQTEEAKDEYYYYTHKFYFDKNGELSSAKYSKDEDVWRYRKEVFIDLLPEWLQPEN